VQCSILTQLAKLGQPDRALATFVWFEQSPQYSISGCLLYTRMISILSRHKRFQAHALRLFDRMLARRISPDLMCFNAAINAAGEEMGRTLAGLVQAVSLPVRRDDCLCPHMRV
jgi:pentatricopeptide repeat protein